MANSWIMWITIVRSNDVMNFHVFVYFSTPEWYILLMDSHILVLSKLVRKFQTTSHIGGIVLSNHHQKEEGMMEAVVEAALKESGTKENQFKRQRPRVQKMQYQNAIKRLQELGDLLDDNVFGEGELEEIIAQARVKARSR